MNPGRASRYVVGSGERCIILVYDIHGFAPANTQHNCDLLADAGFLVVMPDFFRGSGRGQEGFERPDSDVVDAELADIVLPFAKSKGAKSLGMLGFCFGGAVAMRASTTDAFAAVGGIHAGGVTDELAAAATVPVMLLQAGNDPDLASVAEILGGKDLGAKCVLRQFWDRSHGWCGGTGDRAGDPELRAAVEDAMDTSIKSGAHQRRLAWASLTGVLLRAGSSTGTSDAAVHK